MTGGINDIDTNPIPETGGGGRRNRNTALLLLLHPVHCGIAVMSLTHTVIDSRIEQNPFRRGGLSGIDVRHYADITGFIKGVLSRHDVLLSLTWVKSKNI